MSITRRGFLSAIGGTAFLMPFSSMPDHPWLRDRKLKLGTLPGLREGYTVMRVIGLEPGTRVGVWDNSNPTHPDVQGLQLVSDGPVSFSVPKNTPLMVRARKAGFEPIQLNDLQVEERSEIVVMQVNDWAYTDV